MAAALPLLLLGPLPPAGLRHLHSSNRHAHQEPLRLCLAWTLDPKPPGVSITCSSVWQALTDFRDRIAKYEEVYETITDRNSHYIKLIDMYAT